MRLSDVPVRGRSLHQMRSKGPLPSCTHMLSSNFALVQARQLPHLLFQSSRTNPRIHSVRTPGHKDLTKEPPGRRNSSQTDELSTYAQPVCLRASRILTASVLRNQTSPETSKPEKQKCST
jgi:hypothetical protein